MSVGEYIQMAAFNAIHDRERSKLERFNLGHFVGLDYWEEQTPDDVRVWFYFPFGGTMYEVDVAFGRPRNDGSFSWDGAGDFYMEGVDCARNGQ